MDFSQLAEEEKLFLRRLEDLSGLAALKHSARFTSFLNERQLLIAEAYLIKSRCEQGLFYGGFPGALRKMLGFFPGFTEPAAEAFPILGIQVSFPRKEELTHRDFLGALLSLGVKREVIGDILLNSGCGRIYAAAPVAGVILEELRKVGRVGVRCTLALPEDVFTAEQAFLPCSGTVHSTRLDCLVALFTGLSREKSAGLIAAGLVQQNAACARSVSQQFFVNDKISIRGYGKYIVDDIGFPTKKNRLPVRGRKFL